MTYFTRRPGNPFDGDPPQEEVAKAYNPDQPRGPDGRWGEGGGSSSHQRNTAAETTADLHGVTLISKDPKRGSNYYKSDDPTTVAADTKKPEADVRDLDTVMSDHLSGKDRAEYEAKLEEVRRLAKEGQASHTLNGKPGTLNEDGVPKEYTDARQPLHQDIVDKYFDGKSAPEGDPELTILAGRGGSGKGNFGKDGSPMQVYSDDNHTVVIDPDKIKADLIKADGKYLNKDGSPDLQYAFLYHEESSYLSKRLLAEAHAQRYNVVYDTTLSTQKTSLDLLKQYKDTGYSTSLYGVMYGRDDSAASAIERWKAPSSEYRGRLVPAEIPYEVQDTEANYDAVKQLVDQSGFWQRVDTSDGATFIQQGHS